MIMKMETKDLLLRAVTKNDNAEVARMFEYPNAISLQRAEKAIETMAVNHTQNKVGYVKHVCLAVCLKEKPTVIIGWCGLDGEAERDKIVIFYIMDKQYRNKGYATQAANAVLHYAFDQLQLECVYGACDKNNTASFKVMSKIGMHNYGVNENGDPLFRIERSTYRGNHILYDCGLLEELNKYGTPHIIGSYKMNLMAWNDLDIDVENDSMSLDKLHELTIYILNHFDPTWYEAKEEINEQGNKVWFHGFEFYLGGELWNVDIWFLGKDTIKKAEKYCDDISKKIKNNESLKTAIIEIKRELIKRNLYSYDKFTSLDVYDAVLNKNILNINDFIRTLGNFKE